MSDGEILKRDILSSVDAIRFNNGLDGGKRKGKKASRKLVESIFNGGAKKKSKKGSKKGSRKGSSRKLFEATGGKRGKKGSRKGSRKLFENAVIPTFAETSNIGLNGGKRRSKKRSQKRDLPPTIVEANKLRAFMQSDSGLKGGKTMFKFVYHFINKVKSPDKEPHVWAKEAKELYLEEKKKGKIQSIYSSLE